MASAQDRLKLLARSWTMVAEGYDKSFSSRFAPWQRDAIAELQAALPANDSGTIAVPACGPGARGCHPPAPQPHGFKRLVTQSAALPPYLEAWPALVCTPWPGTGLPSGSVNRLIALPASVPAGACPAGQELPLLAAAFPRHRIVGMDLAEGMVEVARRLVAERGLAGRVEVRWAPSAQDIPRSPAPCVALRNAFLAPGCRRCPRWAALSAALMHAALPRHATASAGPPPAARPTRRVGDASRLDELGPLAGVLSVFGLQQMPAPAQVLANWAAALQPGGAAWGDGCRAFPACPASQVLRACGWPV